MTMSTPYPATQILIDLTVRDDEVQLFEVGRDCVVPSGYARLHSAAFLGWMNAPCGGDNPIPLSAVLIAYHNPGESPQLSLLTSVNSMVELQLPPGNVSVCIHRELGRCFSAVMTLGELHERCFAHARRALGGLFEPIDMDDTSHYSFISQETLNDESVACVVRVGLVDSKCAIVPHSLESAYTMSYIRTDANGVIGLSADKQELQRHIEPLKLSPLNRQIFEYFMRCAAHWIAQRVSFAEGCVVFIPPKAPEEPPPETPHDAS